MSDRWPGPGNLSPTAGLRGRAGTFVMRSWRDGYKSSPARARTRRARAEADALRAENARLRELYDNQRNLAKQGWTIDHLLECEEALGMFQADAERYRSGLLAVRALIEPGNPCHDGIREALLDALGKGE